MLIASVPCSYSSDVPLPIVILGEDRLYDIGESLQYRCLPGYQPEQDNEMFEEWYLVTRSKIP